jgi:hypothetical protein
MATVTPPPPAPLPPPSPAEAAPRPVPGVGFLVALLGGLAASGGIILLLIPPLGIAVALLAGVLSGIAVRQARHVITVTVAAVALPFATPFLATCLTGVWGWLVVGIILAAVLLLIATPVAFVIGRAIKPRVGASSYPVLSGLLVVGGVLSILGWILVMLDAINPGTCPPGPGSA